MLSALQRRKFQFIIKEANSIKLQQILKDLDLLSRGGKTEKGQIKSVSMKIISPEQPEICMLKVLLLK